MVLESQSLINPTCFSLKKDTLCWDNVKLPNVWFGGMRMCCLLSYNHLLLHSSDQINGRNRVLRLLDWQKREGRKKKELQSVKPENSSPRRQSIRQEHGDADSLEEQAGGLSAAPLARRDGSAGRAASLSTGVPPNQQLNQQVQPGV